MQELQQHAVGITVDNALDRAVGGVADRVGQFFRQGIGLAQIGHKLAGDRIMRIGWIDQRRDRRGDRQRIAGGQRGQGFGVPVRSKATRDEIADGVNGAAQGTGVQSTSSMDRAAVASITRRSKPMAMPLAAGICPSAARKSSSSGKSSP